jgi:dynein heavy chain 1
LIQCLEEEEVSESGSDGDENVVYSMSEEVRFLNAKINSVVLIKKGMVLEAEKNISSQLRVMNLSDGSPYETLHSYVSAAVAPYFKSYVKETGRAERYSLSIN